MAASRDGWREERAELPGQSGSLWLLPSLRIIPAGRLRLIFACRKTTIVVSIL
jgi:hypothetical protein